MDATGRGRRDPAVQGGSAGRHPPDGKGDYDARPPPTSARPVRCGGGRLCDGRARLRHGHGNPDSFAVAGGGHETGGRPGSGGRRAAGAAAARSSCGASFTRGAKTHTSTKSRPLVDVRAGKHACYDRLVLEFRGPVNGYNIRYVKRVHQDGSGEPLPLAGKAALQVTVTAPAYDSKGDPTYTPADPAHVVSVKGFRSFRQVAWAGSYEGYTTLGVGVRRSLPFRVFVLAGPGRHSRIVVDVAHS